MISLFLLPIASLADAPMREAGPNEVRGQYESWERRLRRRVAKLHTMPEGADRNVIADVVVGFSLGRDGRPADIVVRRSSGDLVYDRAAQRVVRLLGRIGSVPSSAGGRHDVQLKLSYGEAADPTADRRLTDSLDAERRAQAARNLEIVTAAPTQTAIAVGHSAN